MEGPMALSKLLRLRELPELLGGGITERALRAEVRAGRLQFVTLRANFSPPKSTSPLW